MALTTEGQIEQLARFREEKFALVALIGSMGVSGPEDALEQLRQVREIAREQVVQVRRRTRGNRSRLTRAELAWKDILDLANEVEPWLAQVVAVGAAPRRA